MKTTISFLTLMLTFTGWSLTAQNINTIAGNGIQGDEGNGGLATNAKLNTPYGAIALDASGNVYFSDNNGIRKITVSTGIITRIAGDGNPDPGFSGDGGPATSAKLSGPAGIAIDAVDNVYFSDAGNNRIRKVTAATGIISTIAGKATAGYSGDDDLAINASFDDPRGICIDDSNNIYIVDKNNLRIRKITAATGKINTIAGYGNPGFSGDGGPATNADVTVITGICIDAARNIYFTDNDRIRKVTASTGFISTIAGNGNEGYIGDGIPATTAPLTNPLSVSADASGNVYIADSGNDLIRKITFSTGFISTIAGGGPGFAGDGGPATNALFSLPAGILIDAAGYIYIVDRLNHRIRKINAPGLATAKDITAFGFSNPTVTGTISGTNIFVTVPSGTNVNNLVASFTNSAFSSVKVGTTTQVSGTTPNNFTNPVTYKVTAQDATTKSYTVTVTKSTTGINKYENENGFSLYPNPSSGTINLELKSVTKQPLKLLVKDLVGKVVYSEILNTGTTNKQIDLSSQAAGTYLLEVSGGKELLMKKITITNN